METIETVNGTYEIENLGPTDSSFYFNDMMLENSGYDFVFMEGAKDDLDENGEVNLYGVYINHKEKKIKTYENIYNKIKEKYLK